MRLFRFSAYRDGEVVDHINVVATSEIAARELLGSYEVAYNELKFSETVDGPFNGPARVLGPDGGSWPSL